MEEMTNMNWEAMLPPENSENEIKQIEKTLKKRSRKTILTAVVLVIILLLSTVYGIVPLAESFYWSPLDTSFDQYYTDLTLVLRAYTELFMPGKAVSLLWGDVGFAEYELFMSLYDTVRNTQQQFKGHMTRGNLSYDMDFYDSETLGLFRSVQYPEIYPQHQINQDNGKAREKLRELPNYITLKAAVTFPEDLTMAQLLDVMEVDFLNGEADLNIVWAAIRTQAPDPESLHLTTGISFSRTYSDGGINDLYPQFELTHYEPTGATLEEHFKSLLKFSNDRMLEGKAVLTWREDNNFYQQALAYVEENGVKAYGCIVTGTPKTLLSLLDSGKILNIQLLDAWIDVG